MPEPRPEDNLALTIDKELSSLRDHLSFNMERQIERLHDELLHELDELVKRRQSTRDGQPAPALSSLIHTITDSKLHQMNLELRQHMTAKLDVLLQDMKDDQRAFQHELQEQLEQRLSQLNSPRENGPYKWLETLTHSSAGGWSNLPVWIACAILLAMLVSWPT